MNQDKRVVELKNINKSYGSPDTYITQVLFDVNLEVRQGEFVALVGASGSGKTTLLNIIGLLDAPNSGEVILGGKNVASLSEDERALLRRDYLGFIFQFHYLLPEFTALENALMPCRLKGSECTGDLRKKMADLLTRVGLGDRLNYFPNELSGGQQQRVSIVRALANDPVLVLADEPTGNLDSKSGRAVFDLMRDLNKATGKAFLMVTHDETFASYADRVIKIVDGKLLS